MALGIAFNAVELFGVSFALGAFFAGVVLNESELSHRAAHDTLPLRDAFAVLLFAFILAGLGITLGMLSPQGQNLVLAGAILSIMINPLVFALLERSLARLDTEDEKTADRQRGEEPQPPMEVCHHALLVGYGRVGSLIGAKLAEAGMPMVVIENNRARVDTLLGQGMNVVLGNAARLEILSLARLDCPRWLLLTIPNGFEAGEIVALAREKRPDLRIIARAHYDDEVAYITERGATQVVMGEREIATSMIALLHLDAAKPA